MKKLLLIVGIVCIMLCAASILFAALNLSGYSRVYDGSAELYHRLRMRMLLLLTSGVVLGAIGAACLLLRAKR